MMGLSQQPLAVMASQRVCAVCQAELRSGDLACPRCRTLVHGQRLDAISKEALELERAGKIAEARELWRSALPLLPRGSTQADWTEQHLRELDAQIGNDVRTAELDRPQAKPNWK